MSENMIWILIGLALGGAVIAVIIYYLMRFLRGSIKLTLANTAFNPGETIKGSIELLTKKQIQGNKLIVSLIGDQVSKIYKDDKKETRTREIHRGEILIESARVYSAGHSAIHTFEINIPGNDNVAAGNSALGQALSMASSLLSSRETYYEWRVEARLDAEGIDLAKSQKISINL